MPFTTDKPNVSIVKGLLPKCFNPERSVSRFRLAEGLQHIVAFGRQENTVIIVGYDGSFYRCQFDPVTGGVTTQLEKQNFMSSSGKLDQWTWKRDSRGEFSVRSTYRIRPLHHNVP